MSSEALIVEAKTAVLGEMETLRVYVLVNQLADALEAAEGRIDAALTIAQQHAKHFCCDGYEHEIIPALLGPNQND